MPNGKQDPNATKERYEGDTQERSWDANVKRTSDEYQDVALACARHAQTHFDEAMIQARRQQEEMHKVTLQILQHGVTQANQLTQIATRRMWELEPAEAAAMAQVLPTVYLDAIKAIVVDILDNQDAGKKG